ncbi:MAG: efflux RND transporter periplasmic adaptor subunit [Bacteroidetes bacterium]|nr:efflux RND transporter periplasmic adaptor subunit [Bacteroidota bacterium]
MRFTKYLLIIILPFVFMSLNGCEENSENSAAEKESSEKSLSTRAAVSVEAMIVKNKSVEEHIPLVGRFEPLNSVELIAEVNGKIISVAENVGSQITKKDTLAVVDDRIPLSEFKQAQALILSAENNLKIAETNFSSDKILFGKGDISAVALENSGLTVKSAKDNLLSAKALLIKAQKQFEDTRILSPINGFISRKYIETGTMVSAGMPLFRIVDILTLKINVGLPQIYIDKVRLGDKVEVTVSALNDEMVNGHVKRISPQADESSGLFNVEIHVSNIKGMRIKAGMTAQVTIILTEKHPQLLVPSHAIVSKNEKSYVYRIHSNVAKLTEVYIPRTVGSQVIIGEGIAAADTIVVVGMKNLGIETSVKIESIN